MQVASRLISGTIASWIRIGITMLFQLVFTPLYLTYWNVETYGIWLAIQAFIGIVATLDTGHQTYLGFEFLKIGRNNRSQVSLVLWSGAAIGVVLGLVVSAVVMIINTFFSADFFFDIKPKSKLIIHDASIVLFLQMIIWVVFVSIGGILIRALEAFGYYPRMSWWGILSALITGLAPIIAIIFGAGLLGAGIVTFICSVFYYLILFCDLISLIKKEDLYIKRISIKLGISNFKKSLIISVKNLSENIRQQGTRLVLIPFVGPAGMAAFSTIRTGANIALQGLSTVTHPLMPELMHFLHKRDQQRSEVAFGTVWIVVVGLMAPGLVIIQVFSESFYMFWIRGQLSFDPLLFSLLSLGVLVYASAQPAIAVVTGNNLLKPQLLLSILAAFIVVGMMFLLVPIIGIAGAGVALLAAEIIATIGYRIVAKRWLEQNGLSWPQGPATIVIVSVWVSAISMGLIVWLPHAKWFVLVVALVILLWNFWRYWKVLPFLAKQHLRKIIRSFLESKKYLRHKTS